MLVFIIGLFYRRSRRKSLAAMRRQYRPWAGKARRGLEPAAPEKPLSKPGRRQRAKELAAAAIEGIIDQDTRPKNVLNGSTD
jgi:hypothetical protein